MREFGGNPKFEYREIPIHLEHLLSLLENRIVK